MPVYIGSLGRMVKLPYVGSQQVQSEERYNFSSTLEGKRKAQVKPKGPRTWALSADHFRPNEHSLLSQFANGAWGNGPFVFIPVDAPHTNLLTPDASMCKASENPSVVIYAGGPMKQPDGSWAGSSYFSPQPSLRMFFGRRDPSLPEPGERLPVLPGGVVTGGATVLGDGARAQLAFYDHADLKISTVNSGITASAGSSVVSSVTAMPPAGAASCRVIARSSVQGSAPFFTWGDRPPVWAEGQGCLKAVVSSMSRDQVLAVPGHTFSNVSFTVTEVG